MSDSKQYFTTPYSQTAKVTTLSFAAAGFSCLIAGILLLLYVNAKSHLPLHTTINGIDVGNRTVADAKNKLEKQLLAPPLHQVTLSVDAISVASNSSELEARYDVDKAILPLVGTPQNAHIRTKVFAVLQRYFTTHEATLDITYNPEKLNELLALLQTKVEIPAQPPRATLRVSGNSNSLEIFAGIQGRTVAVEAATQLIAEQKKSSDFTVAVPVASTGAVLDEAGAQTALSQLQPLVGTTITFSREGIPFVLKDTDTVGFIDLVNGGVQSTAVAATVSRWEKAINRPPQEPQLEYNKETLAVTKFVPPRNGLTLDVDKTTKLVSDAIRELQTPSEPKVKQVDKKLPLAELPPKKSLADFNTLGIKERIGFGESYYAHSIPNRIHNVALAASRISLHIVKPGEEFSFNKTLGEVSGETGFKSAYVIQGNRTVLGDGGGVCQVSSTLFRAVLNAGLDVTRRLPHSYRVSYYELNSKPGIDATVYSGETDFRFKNDTDHAILIYGEADSRNLYMFYELYGTSDGRTAEIVDHKTWNFRPAPPPVYIPDPSVPPGKTVQVDWAAAGVSASFKNIVKDKTGRIIREDTYVSNYRPWSAKYLQGVAQ